MSGPLARRGFPRLAGALLVLAMALAGATHSAAADDNFPPGGTLPVGWTTSIGAAAGWTVAIDSFNGSPNSLKSAAILDSQSAAIQVGGNFAAGNVSFAYRVSSEACCDSLKFYIDDALRFSAAGEVPWTGPLFFPVPAGVHVFKWVYVKDDSVAAGTDAAWIDTVVLPSGPVYNPLNVTRAGGGGGTVTSNPAGVNCGVTCEAYFAPASTVTLTAAPVAGSIFTGWSGACTGTTPSCGVAMSAAKSVTASFALPDDDFPPGGKMPVGWTTSPGADAGWVVTNDSAYHGVYNLKSATILDSQSAAIQVAGTYAAGNVSFAYHVSSEFEFDWFEFYIDGALRLSASDEIPWTPVSFPVTAGAHTFKWVYVKDVSESFGADAAQIDSVVLPPGLPDTLLNVTRAGSGAGTVTSTPAGISCGATCAALFISGSTVTLTATPVAGSTFTGWSEACTTTPCVVTMNAAKNVTATFTLLASSSTALGASTNPSVFGQSVTLTATVTGSAPTGTATFNDGATTLCNAVALAGGQAPCLTSALGVGSHSLTAVYSGDGNNAGSTGSPLTQTVNKAATTTTISAHTPNPSSLGAPIAVTASVAVTAPGAGTPTGTITVSDGSANCVITLPATGCNLIPLSAGATTLTATYAGDGSFLGSVSPGVGHTVTTAALATLDVDASITATRYDALTDGLLTIRYLFGLTGSPLTTGALGSTATRTDPAAIKAYLDGMGLALDIDDDGRADALTDGLLITRYLFGLRGNSLIAGAVGPQAKRKTAPDIEAYLLTLTPP